MKRKSVGQGTVDLDELLVRPSVITTYRPHLVFHAKLNNYLYMAYNLDLVRSDKGDY